MGAAAFVFIMLALLFFGVVCIAAGAVCLAIFSGMSRRGVAAGKPLSIVFAVVLGFGVLMVTLPIGFFGFIVYVNSTPPYDYVETAVVIEENGYQDTRFTADGVVYRVLELEANFEVCDTLAEPVFSYKTAGFLNGSQCGNYYRLENDRNFDLIWDGGSLLFSPEDQAEEIFAYYTEECGSEWYFYDEEWLPNRLSAEAEQAMNELSAYDLDSMPQTELVSDTLSELHIVEWSSDGIVWRQSLNLIFEKNAAYLVYTSAYDENGMGTYTVVRLPLEVERPLLAAFSEEQSSAA